VFWARSKDAEKSIVGTIPKIFNVVCNLLFM